MTRPPTIPLTPLTQAEIDRFWSKVDRSGDCWVWAGLRDRNGYGRFRLHGKMMAAHRIAFFLAEGGDPGWLEVLHSCDNPPCVKFAHLFGGTQTANLQDMHAKGRHTHGERSAKAKLADAQIVAILELYDGGRLTMAEIGARYGVKHSTISRIVGGQTWKHLGRVR